MAGKPDALKALQEAKRAAMARAEAKEAETQVQDLDLTPEECLVQLTIHMFASGLKLGMGVMPDGMAVFIRLSFPPESTDPRAGMVSFVVSNDIEAVLLKAVSSLEASAQSNFWKKDRFARVAE